MARGVRKTNKEKLEEQLSEVKTSIAQYRESLRTLENREKELTGALDMEDLRELSSYLKENNLSLESAKQIIEEYQEREA